MDRYNVDEDSIFIVMSYDGNFYICNTCDNNRMPCQGVANKLFVENLLKQFQGINRLERLPTSRSILFKKVTVMPKGKSLKMRSSICDIQVTEVNVNCNTLPWLAGLLIVKLKRKLDYKSHVKLEAVRPALLVHFLGFLKLHNHLNLDIEINYNNIPVDMLGCHNEKLEESEIYLLLLRSLDEPIEVEVELSTNEEINEDPLCKFRSPSVETIISEVPSNFELEQETTIAPIALISVLNDKFCEELAHPHLYFSGWYGYETVREIPLSSTKYFNQRLLHYSQKFAAYSDYIFFAHLVLQKVQFSS